MKTIIFTLVFAFSISLCGQNYDSKKILAEGKLLYRLEKGSWYGTDNFMENFAHKKEHIGGYLSYEAKGGYINTIFYDRNNPDNILARYKFDKTPQRDPISVDTLNSTASQMEKDLIAIRNDTQSRMVNNEDSLFVFYQNTQPNLIPVITKKEKKVYVITGSTTHGKVLLGNDYLLTYDQYNNLTDTKRLHNSLIELPYGSGDKVKPMAITMHSHVVSDVIDPTDICTMLLYREFVEWNQHIVVSKDYVSIFILDQERLEIMTFDEWEKFNSKD